MGPLFGPFPYPIMNVDCTAQRLPVGSQSMAQMLLITDFQSQYLRR